MLTLMKKFRRTAQERTIRQEWDFQRARAMSTSHAAEIDAIFSRYL